MDSGHGFQRLDIVNWQAMLSERTHVLQYGLKIFSASLR